MRYTILFIALLCFTGSAFAQQSSDQDSEKDTSVFPEQKPLPQEGDFALGFDATPFLEFVGNIFNNSDNNSVKADFVGEKQQIMGKYFLSDDIALRGRLGIKQNNTTNEYRAPQDNRQLISSNIQVTDELKEHETSIDVGAGVEFRRGEGRLVGIYGGEISFNYEKYSTDISYGNRVSAGNQTPTTATEIPATIEGPDDIAIASSKFVNGSKGRLVEAQAGKKLGVGLNGFVGVEYFVAPRISVSAEFTVGAKFNKKLQGESTYEFWNTATNSVETVNYVEGGGNDFKVETGNYSGAINLMFYF